MKFIDEAIINVRSGNGGSGFVSFRREKYIPRGRPDGGDGGKGGDVTFFSTTKRRTLNRFRYLHHFNAPNGTNGQGRRKTGKNGADIVIEIPPGTVINDHGSGTVLKDFTQPFQEFIVAKGGRGGQGNSRFKSSTNRSPRFAQPGEDGEQLTLKLELKLLADVGIIGLPNAGKSTLISVLSAARPKIGDYPFTTLTPSLGVVASEGREPFVLADIPGLIEGAHTGAGLGIQFLRHIERTHILIHLIDASAIDADHPLKGYETINKELTAYSQKLEQKFQIVVLNKLDLPHAEPLAEKFKSVLGETSVLCISAATRRGLDTLNTEILKLLDARHDTSA